MKKIPFIIFLLLSTGCATQKTDYLLRPLPISVAAAPQTKEITALRDVDLPDYLNTLNFQYLRANNQLVKNPHARWGQNLPENVRNVLLQNLGYLSKQTIHVYPLAPNIRPTRWIDVRIYDMIADEKKQQFYVHAVWHIARAKQPPKTFTLIKHYPLNAVTPQELSQQYQHAIDDLSHSIAQSLKSFLP